MLVRVTRKTSALSLDGLGATRLQNHHSIFVLFVV